MAVGLNALSGPAPGRMRRVGLAAVVTLVIVAHGCVSQYIGDQMADLDAAKAMPGRIEVVYVRDMPMSAPTLAAPAAPPAALTLRVPRSRPPKPARVASAPEEVVETVVAEAAPEAPPVVTTPDVAVPEPAAAASAPTDAASAVDALVDPLPAMATAAASAASAPELAAFEWPASTRVSYLLTGNFRGDVNGSAQVEWVRVGSHYQVHLDLVVGPSIAPIITRRMSSDGEITAEGLSPRRYDQDTKVVLRNRNVVSIGFEPGAVVLANGERRASVPGVQDTASQFVQLMYVFSTRPELLRVGNTIDIPLALPHKVDVWTYDVVEEEELATPFGPLPSVHIKPRRAPQPGELSAEIWFAPQLRYFPVRIRIRQDTETFIDLMVSKRPEMAG